MQRCYNSKIENVVLMWPDAFEAVIQWNVVIWINLRETLIHKTVL